MKIYKITGILLLICMLTSCSFSTIPFNDSKDSFLNIKFITDKEKESWKKPLQVLISDMKYKGDFDSHLWDGYALALFDINLDSVPELIEVEAGGSAGNVNYYAYDIHSGELITSFEGGVFHSQHSDSWCIYLDIETDQCKIIGNYTTRGGSTLLNRHIDELRYNSVTGEYIETSLFYAKYNIDEAMTEEGYLVEDNVCVQHFCNSKTVTASEYNYKYDLFISSHIRISNTGMKLVRWVDVEVENDCDQTVSNMVNALINSGQMFVNQ